MPQTPRGNPTIVVGDGRIWKCCNNFNLKYFLFKNILK
jgi:hypothetical protein